MDEGGAAAMPGNIAGHLDGLHPACAYVAEEDGWRAAASSVRNCATESRVVRRRIKPGATFSTNAVTSFSVGT